MKYEESIEKLIDIKENELFNIQQSEDMNSITYQKAREIIKDIFKDFNQELLKD